MVKLTKQLTDRILDKLKNSKGKIDLDLANQIAKVMIGKYDYASTQDAVDDYVKTIRMAGCIEGKK